MLIVAACDFLPPVFITCQQIFFYKKSLSANLSAEKYNYCFYREKMAPALGIEPTTTIPYLLI